MAASSTGKGAKDAKGGDVGQIFRFEKHSGSAGGFGLFGLFVRLFFGKAKLIFYQSTKGIPNFLMPWYRSLFAILGIYVDIMI
jgi:hypothetical protein